MNKFLMSSIMGSDFINYRKYTGFSERSSFVRSAKSTLFTNVSGVNSVGLPIIIDSIDSSISKLLSGTKIRYDYGKQYIINEDTTITMFLDQIIEDLKTNIKILNGDTTLTTQFKYKLGLEDGTLILPSLTLCYIYRKHRYSDDILYMLLTKELTVYGYIMSLFNYIFRK
jgi:hypothetical protein